MRPTYDWVPIIFGFHIHAINVRSTMNECDESHIPPPQKKKIMRKKKEQKKEKLLFAPETPLGVEQAVPCTTRLRHESGTRDAVWRKVFTPKKGAQGSLRSVEVTGILRLRCGRHRFHHLLHTVQKNKK